MSVKRVLIFLRIAIASSLPIAACAASATDGGEAEDSENHEEAPAPSGDAGAHALADDPGDASTPGGQHVGEAAACEALLGAQEAKIKSLGCALTTRTCPSLLRVMTGMACLEYDAGSVQNCIKRYQAPSTCEDLAYVISACVVTFYPGTKSADCDG